MWGQFSLFFVYTAVVGWLTAYLEVSCWMCTGERQSARIRAKYLRAILRQEVAYFEKGHSSTAEVVNNVSADTLLVQEAMSEKVGNFIQYMSAFVGGYIVAYVQVWRLALAATPFIPLLLLPGAFYNRAVTSLSSRMQSSYNKAGAIAEESISSVRTVYSFVGESKVAQLYSSSLDETVRLGIKQGLAKGLSMGSVGINFAIWAFLGWYGSEQVLAGRADGGNILTTGIAVIAGGIALGNAMPNFKAFAEGCSAASRIFALIARVPPIDADDTTGKTLEKVVGDLELRNVDFSYPSRSDVPVFKNFSLKIPAGKTVALVGQSGSGKSTVIALLERFYDPLAGEVLIDGANIKDLQLKWLRRQIGLVSQEPALFATSIRENILYGKDGASDEEIMEAAKSANAYNFVSQLPRGFDTQVGERGVQMSGGQKQRIAIARALLKNPPVMLLDEATSALDAESEKVVQAALERAAEGRTTVVVAHRLSTIRNADLIAVVQYGKVVEMGTHEELMAKGEQGAFAALVQLQQAHQEAEAEIGAETAELKDKIARNSSSFHKRSVSSSRKSFEESRLSTSKRDYSMNSNQGNATEKKAKVKPQIPSFRRLLALNRPEWRQAFLGLTGAIAFGFVQPFYGFFLGDMLASFYDTDRSKLRHDIKIYAGIFCGLAVAAFVVNTLQHYNFAVMGEHLTKRIRVRMLVNILRFEVGWYDRDENASGAICSRLGSDSNMVRALVGDRISLIVQTASAILVSFGVGLSLSWKLALVVMSIQPIIIISLYTKKILLTGFAKHTAKAQHEGAQVASEAVAQHRTVTAFSSQDKVLALFEAKLEGPKKEIFKRAQVAGLGLGAANFFLYASWGLDYWYGGKLASAGEVSFADVLKTFFVLVSTGRVLAEAGALAPDLAKGSQAIASVFNILDRETEIDADKPNAQKVEKVEGNIELQGVQFSYPARPDVMIFKNFNLSVRAGQTVAMVGQSGSGKSTIIGLIERFYDPVKGKVLIDGRDIKTLHLQSLRRHIGLVSQEPTLFAGTLRENIAYGKQDATETEITEAAVAANAHNFISALPKGYDTFAGERGLQLSGGQKQRIAIARAILKNPAILLLDEATSALDAESERVVQDALDRMMVGRTTVVVAHRLSTIASADTIAVMQDGVILEQGSHDQLMSKGESSAYYSLVRLQTSLH
ncbi:hypothetical protein M758_6G113700 [Ceratodon purpureus]|nr:hypothetical protein M758_6G113700 [Ceratodon purpureus]